MLTILNSTVIVFEEPIWPSNEHKNLHFDIDWDNHVSSKNNETKGYEHD